LHREFGSKDHAGGKTELGAAEKAFVVYFSFFLNYPRNVCAGFSQKTGGFLS
jgi:hypothetical protein